MIHGTVGAQFKYERHTHVMFTDAQYLHNVRMVQAEHAFAFIVQFFHHRILTVSQALYRHMLQRLFDEAIIAAVIADEFTAVDFAELTFA